MDEPPIHLGAREQRRARFINAHLACDLTVEQVATLLGVPSLPSSGETPDLP